MKTSDKELDDLFNSKLNDLEIEPHPALWNNVAAGLDKEPKKKSVVPILQIAASVLVIFSVGLLFLRKNDQPVKNPIHQKVVKIESKPEQTQKAKLGNKLADKKDMLLLSAKNKAVKEVSSIKRNKKISVLKPFINPKSNPNYTSTQTIAQSKPQPEQHQELPVNNFAQVKTAVVPDTFTSLKIQPEIEVPLKESVKLPVLAAANGKVVKAKHKSIRNMGDLVNLVMAKVDKRQDKLIEFSDSDDGEESNVTGINLGIISIKKEK